MAVAFDIPVILSTVGVKMNVNQPTIEGLRKELPNLEEIDRSSMNAWEDAAFLKAVKETGKKRLIFCALWTEICLAFPVIDALEADYEVAIIADAVGENLKLEHDTAISRMVHAGAIPNTTMACMTEWFRDWKSPQASIARPLIVQYLTEKRELEKPEDEASEESQHPTMHSPH